MALLQFLALIPFAFLGQQTTVAAAPDISVPLQGIYLTSTSVAGKTGEKLADDFAKIGGNMIVFDIQDSNGKIAFPSNLPISIELENRKEQIKNLSATVKKFHDKGFYMVARFVLFKNGFIAGKKPEWTIKTKGTKSPFVSRDGPIWLDPGNLELQEYLIDLGREIAMAGVDEIQFDYVRFPEGGKGGYSGFSFTGDAKFTKDQAITNFVTQAAAQLHILGTAVSADIFGIVVWDNLSWKIIGQNVAELAKPLDALYPMPYPSHFGPGWGGHKNPADEPYFFVQETTKKFMEQTKDSGGTKIRPWLQGFAMRVTKYGPGYIEEQARALKDIGIEEFTVWNAANNYQVTFDGLQKRK
ncbi:MAG: putative glycoside hydrolase [Patescibacteria group bacterium]